MKVAIYGTRDGRLIADVRGTARRLTADGHQLTAVNVIFVTDRYIHDLNLRYRRRDRPTDVLSFHLPPTALKPGASLPAGEVYVSRDTARRQARERGLGYHDELRRLVLHGLLHLLGLTHKQMEPLYRRYLSRP